MTLRTAVVITIAVALLVSACSTGQVDTGDLPAEPTRTATTRIVSPTIAPTTTVGVGRERVLVDRVIDGDTIVIEGGARVRYIGIDTPEDTSTKECFGDRATARNRDAVEGRFVELERDISETDRFGRLLRYVWVDGAMVNELLVAEGFALASTYPPDVRRQALLLLAESAAREARLGLWSVCVDDAPPAVPPSNDSGGCDPSYPDVCIPPRPPDLDCADLPYVNIRVLPPDPHRLDGNADGVGCEA